MISAKPNIFFMIALSVEHLGGANRIVNMTRRPPNVGTFMTWTVCEKWADFALSAFVRPIGNKESKNQPRGDREKNCFECEW
jgi:hypothetical protein